jgi:hypothetical protein
MNDREVADALREIQRLAEELARAGEDHLALRNRAIEIAAMANVMLWSVAPDESGWLDDLYAVTEKEDK